MSSATTEWSATNGWISISSISIKEAQGYATKWLWTYNNERPNMGIGGITPVQKLNLAA
jgi:putative transposase